MKDRIEKTIELKAPVGRVWKAITDHKQFGEWFRVALDGPFEVGEVSTGRVTYPGYEHMQWEATVKAMEPETYFSYTWFPSEDYEGDDKPTTLVEFRLEAIPTGTRLKIIESGFSALPDDPRRVDAMRENEGGWEEQAKNIAAHVEARES